MNCTFGAFKGNSIHGATARIHGGTPIHDNGVANSLKKGVSFLSPNYIIIV